MSQFWQAFWAEALKARRSRMPLLTALGFALAPLVGGYFMMVLKDPALALRLGLITAKAQLMAVSADWPSHLGFLAQATAVGGFLVFGLVGAWVFGREYADHTIVDLLALPTHRVVIVLAKFLLITVWSAALTAINYLISLALGLAIALPPAPNSTFVNSAGITALTAGMTLALVTPIAFVASAGRGYLPPVGAAILAVLLAQVMAAAGWGEVFPWSIPALYAGLAGPVSAMLDPISYRFVAFTGLAGLIGTALWWELADQAR